MRVTAPLGCWSGLGNVVQCVAQCVVAAAAAAAGVSPEVTCVHVMSTAPGLYQSRTNNLKSVSADAATGRSGQLHASQASAAAVSPHPPPHPQPFRLQPGKLSGPENFRKRSSTLSLSRCRGPQAIYKQVCKIRALT